MRVKLLIVLALVAALGLVAPARADFTGYCNPDPYFCVGVEQFEDGSGSGTFLIVDTDGAGVFAGTESDTDTAYTAAGACGGALVTGGCLVLVQYGEELYLYTDSDAGCMMVPLNGGTHDWCNE